MKSKTLGEKIREYRKKAKLSQEQLAAEIPCDRKMISLIETGEANVYEDILKRIGDILNFQVDLVDVTEVEKPHNLKDYWISFSELKELEKDMDPFEVVLTRLLFEGVAGTDKILHLKIDDVDFENGIVHIPARDSGESRREIKVSEECLKFIKVASEQKVIKIHNVERPVQDSPYVLKSYNDSRSPVILYNKILDIQKRTGKLQGSFFNNARNSGMLYMANCLLEQEGKLEEEQLSKICSQYGWPLNETNGDFRPNIDLLQDIVNEKNLELIYN